MAVLGLCVVLAVSALLLWAIFVVAYAVTLLAPPRMTDAKALARLGRLSPADLGWTFQTWAIRGAGDIPLAAWWVPAEGSRRTVVLLHAFGDARVGALAWGPVWRDLGFNLLLLDGRAHGDSGGKIHTAGRLEADDLRFALDHLLRLAPTACHDVLLFGASFGAAVASHAAGGELPPQVRGLVLDSPVASFGSGALAHAALFALPGPWVGRPAVRLAELLAGHRFGPYAATNTLPAARVPALVILPERDAYVNASARAALQASFETHQERHPAARQWQPASTHLLAVNAHPAAYREQLAAFLAALGL